MRDYAELVKALRVCGSAPYDCSDCPINPDECAGVMSLFSIAADAIEELLKEVRSRENDCINLTGECATYYAQIPHWISVKDRLPEIGKFVLVSDGDDIDAASRYKAFTIPDEVETFFWDSVLEVTHWMPLPKAPKEETE